MPSSTVWRDDPLTSAASDDLGTVHVARRVAQLVADTHSFESSTVVGLVGPWGSGKSSIVAMACEALGELPDPQWSVGRFTPWATNSTESMMADFYATLSRLLPEDKSKAIRANLTRMARIGTSALKLIPVAGEAASGVAQSALDELLTGPSWDEAFADVSSKLATWKLPVLIVVDDVDRLQQSELTTLLKVIRLLGRFPGVTYLLAYDEQTLFATLKESALAAHNDQTARLFMEKVVQYPVSVPPLLPDQVLERLDEGLAAAFGDLGRTIEDGDSRLTDLTEAYISQLRTPRALSRFLAQVRLTLSMHEVGEVDDVDVVILTLLRVQFPDLYAQLPRWKPELTGSMSMRRRIKQGSYVQTNESKVDFSPLFESVSDPADREDAQDIVAQLFPATSPRFSLSAGVDQSMRNVDYFDRYLVHSVPAGDVPDAQVRAAVQQASDGGSHDLMTSLLAEGSPSRIALAVRHMGTASVAMADELNVVNVLGAVMYEWSNMPREHGMIRDTRRQMGRWAAELMMRLPADVDADDLEAALAQCSDPEGPLSVLWDVRGRDDDAQGADSDGDSAPAGSAIAVVGRRFADRALQDLLDHLAAGDDADEEFLALFRLYLIEAYGDADAAVAQVRKMVTSGAVTVESLAARFVTVAYTIGVPKVTGRLNAFDQETFATFAPPSDPFYEEDKVSGLDTSDLSWSNRRAFARGRSLPPTPPAPET